MLDEATGTARPEIAVTLAKESNRRMLIDGRLCDATDGRRMEVVSPTDGLPLGDVPCASVEDVDKAVAAAARAFEHWRWTSVKQRRDHLLAFAAHLQSDGEALAVLDTLDGGHPLAVMKAEVGQAVFSLELTAGMAFEWGGRQVPTGDYSIDFAVREPYGVTAKIVPFNHPFLFAATKIAAPLLTGNTVVLKVPDQTPLSGLRMAEALAELFPPGVVNVISGVGGESGNSLIRHPLVNRVGFTGSVSTARKVLHGVADRIVPALLELGGKNPFIVCEDADLPAAMAAAVTAMNFKTAGQSCGSFSRLFLHEAVHDEALDLLADGVRRVRVRNPFSPEADMGALISPEARSRCEMAIETARRLGADLILGGSRPTGAEFGQGWYLEPAVLGDVTPDMPVAKEEVFGPVLAVSRWSSEEGVITEANSIPYGLTAGVWTQNLDRAMRMAHRLEAGVVSVNGDGRQHWPGAPFGGYKESGYGKEESLEELLESTRMKNIHIDVQAGPLR
jgi:betaine-aldehyde dehydrogenase